MQNIHTHMLKMVSRWVQCVITGVFLEQLALIKWSAVLFLLGPHHRRTPEVSESCHLFKCERARKSYLKDYLMAASSPGWAKRSAPLTVLLRCWPAFEMQSAVRCGSIAVDIITVFRPQSAGWHQHVLSMPSVNLSHEQFVLFTICIHTGFHFDLMSFIKYVRQSIWFSQWELQFPADLIESPWSLKLLYYLTIYCVRVNIIMDFSLISII